MKNAELRALMKDQKLSYKVVAKVLGVSVTTIRAWMSPVTSKNYRGTRQIYFDVLDRYCRTRRK